MDDDKRPGRNKGSNMDSSTVPQLPKQPISLRR